MGKRDRRNNKYMGGSMKFKSVKECQVLAFYLHELLDWIEKSEDSFTLDFYYVKPFLEIADVLDIDEPLSACLQDAVDTAAKCGDLRPVSCKDDDGGTVCIGYSNIPMAYKEDNYVEHCMGSDYPFSIMLANLLRFLFSGTGDWAGRLMEIIKKFCLPKNGQLKKALEDTDELDFAVKSMSLSDDEARVLTLNYRVFSCRSLRKTFTSELSNSQIHEVFQSILGMSDGMYKGLVSEKGRLRLMGLLEDDGLIERDFLECVEAQSMQPFFADLVKECDIQTCYDVESFNVDGNAVKIMCRLLKSDEPVSILLHGKPGTGKTQLARTLSHGSGRKVLVFKNESELAENGMVVFNRLNCLLSTCQKDAVIIIDEADKILQTKDTSVFGLTGPAKTKGIVNKMLELTQNKIIWIVNGTSQIDESTLRRFTYSYRFEAMTSEQLRSISASKLEPLALPQELNGKILDMMERYSVTGASVENIAKTIRCLRTSTGDDLLDCVQSVLKENSQLINGKARMREEVSSSYNLGVLNTSEQPDRIVRMIENAQKFAQQAAKTHHAKKGENGIRMLFYGVSGTGKTEFARYIAQLLGKKILLKRASDILGMFVGQSEKNIRDAFEEAERTGSILLFDEADSFFSDRSKAVQSWERTQVNEFLTQMEEFDGILICTTNLKKIMDPAMNRRFHIIVEFKPLSCEGIRSLLQGYFPSCTFTEEQLRSLDRCGSVTPGDFAVLAGKVRFMDEEDMSADFIIGELLKIQDEKQTSSCGSRVIGFCGAA